MSVLIGVDAGGTSTRAVCVDERGRMLGYGEAAGGNAVSHGRDVASAHIVRAITAALAEAGVSGAEARGVVCAAGDLDDEGLRRIGERAGLRGAAALTRAGDAVAGFFSAADQREGFAFVVGTGAGIFRVCEDQVVRAVDGLGWLLGDIGSGFWLGSEVARAVAADLDGTGSATALSAAVLAQIAPEEGARWGAFRSRELAALLTSVYDAPPVALAKLAPLAFAHENEDGVAAEIVRTGERALVERSRRIRADERDLPVVASGSVLTQGYLAGQRAPGALAEELSDTTVHLSIDGLVGAAALALSRVGFVLSPDARESMRAAVRQRRVSSAENGGSV